MKDDRCLVFSNTDSQSRVKYYFGMTVSFDYLFFAGDPTGDIDFTMKFKIHHPDGVTITKCDDMDLRSNGGS